MFELKSTETEEKLDYLKNLEEIKVQLRQKLLKYSKEHTGYWYIDLETNSFTCSHNLSHVFELDIKKDGLEYYLSTYHKNIPKEIENIQNNLKNVTVDRKIKSLKKEDRSIIEHIDYIPTKKLLMGIVQDMTEILSIRKNMQNIDKHIHQLMKIFDKNISILHCDKDTIVTYASSAFCQATGYEKSHINTKPLSFFECNNENINLQKIFKSLKSSKLTWNGEVKYRKKDNSIFWAKTFISPIYNQDNTLSKFTLFCHDITTQKMLEELTSRDAMTGLYNRRHYNEIIPKEINRAKRNKQKISFAMLDIDFFKQYNDIYGHRMGDDAIISVANALKKSLKRGGDIAFRMGGEEFCIVFTDYDNEKSLKFCEKIKDDIENLKIPHSGSKINDNLTISIGLVVSNLADEVIDELGLYTTSDNALYEAKAAGRNKVFLHKANDMELF